MKCAVEWCYDTSPRFIRGFCSKHYQRVRMCERRGVPFVPIQRPVLTVESCDNGDGTATIPLFNKSCEKIAETIIDTEDLERVLQAGSWHLHYKNTAKRQYVSTGMDVNGKRKQVKLHRFLMDCPDGFDVDHISRDTLDNRKSNLRICHPFENAQNQKVRKTNKTGYRGVHKKGNKFIAISHVRVDKGVTKRIMVGKFDTAEEANEANTACRKANLSHAID